MDFYKMKDFFGSSLASPEAWEKKRAEIKSLILNEEYGSFAPLPAPEISVERQGINFASKADWDRVSFTFSLGEKTHTVDAELILLKDKPLDKPLFIYIDFSKETPSKYLPVEEILDSGCGIFKVYYEDITTDNGDFENGLCALLSGGGESYGKIAVWSYFLRVMADYIRTLGHTGTLGVVGHSRLGKTALLTAALDERFDIACVNDSGCSGASLSRFKSEGEETIKDIVGTFPFWFKKKYHSYVDNEEALPFDQHMLMSLISPRVLSVSSATMDNWANPYGEYTAAQKASEISALYGRSPIPKLSDIKDFDTNTVYGKDNTYFLREGMHYMSREDWQLLMKCFDKNLCK